jgi:GTP cyclohydrolase I
MEMDNRSAILPWCPLRPHDVPLCNGHSKRMATNGAISPKSGPPPSNMVSAVSAMLLSLGEDPLRKELLGSPQHLRAVADVVQIM